MLICDPQSVIVPASYDKAPGVVLPWRGETLKQLTESTLVRQLGVTFIEDESCKNILTDPQVICEQGLYYVDTSPFYTLDKSAFEQGRMLQEREMRWTPLALAVVVLLCELYYRQRNPLVSYSVRCREHTEFGYIVMRYDATHRIIHVALKSPLEEASTGAWGTKVLMNF